MCPWGKQEFYHKKQSSKAMACCCLILAFLFIRCDKGPIMVRVILCGAHLSSLEIAEGARTTLSEQKNPYRGWEIVIRF